MLIEATFSITARCARSGQLGIGVATRVPAVGAAVPHLRARVGAIASQATTNPYLGIDGLDLLAAGASAAAVCAALVAWDPAIEHRQFAVVDARGGAAGHTGSETLAHAGHRTGVGYVVAGNLLAGPDVLVAMQRAWQGSANLDLAERLLRALEAGQAAGGDRRGKQSAALRVVADEEYSHIDLRVDEHGDPIPELRRVHDVWCEVMAPHLAARPTRAGLREQTGRERPTLVP
jgi:uncharacterized Ntn-hydrolase superfamily protein